MYTFLQKYSLSLRIIAYIIVGYLILKLLLFLILPTPKLPDDAKAKLNTIDSIVTQLEAKQKHLDSLLLQQDQVITQLNTKITTIKEKTTIIKEYYHEVSQQVDHYDPTQVDSFFKSRYNY